MIRLVFLAMVSVFLALPAAAHELMPAYLDIDEIAAERYAISWKVPARGEMKLALYVELPAGCRQVTEPAGGHVESAHVTRWQSICDGGLAGKTISINGLSSTYTDALVRITHLTGMHQTSRISPDGPDMVVAASPTAIDTARTYFLLGMEHIMLGFDHLLFVFALLLLISRPKTLVLTITSFTVAHSITLAFATMGIAAMAQPPIEALIALSIMFVASEIIRSYRGSRDLSSRYPWLISFIFGLLHGFGFGGALRDIGLPQTDVPLALLTFNLGVEAGQLIFVGLALAALACIRLLVSHDLSRLRYWLAYLIGTMSAFWFVQRVAGF
jgi:hydrogenase/urease accessory protein HupE